MKAVSDVDMGQHIAVGGERSLALALLESQPAVTQEPGELLASRWPRAGLDECGIQPLGHVEMVAFEPTGGYAGLRRERAQLVIRAVTDQVRPQPAVCRPAGWVDPDRHRPPPSLAADPNASTRHRPV